MTFRLVYSEEALAQLRKLDNPTAKRILDRVDSVLEDPAHFFKRLAGRDEYKLRVGDYRVLARVPVRENTVFIMSLGHRKNIYKQLE
ncbi:type II toxin-antitoxin system RelE/ParE family toxin [Candidatus Micrarchaeota archaeon]|nr:type II toxin-antitoxin system RelE/ParE family toxin [Candidatus Micrarchaeota archaeon]